EPQPVKRTVKNYKILATSNCNVAGCFYLFPSPGRQVSSVFSLLTQKRVLRVTTSGAARPSASVLSLDFVPAPCIC
ncbi:hypothetical protein, partial [Ruthenibacterium lactatiformans]|uniref:hypothetical protein n=1 Tax=Ruthenibacterium lactatiformans TaxID=1550024 RepID=UPI0019D5A334